MSASDSRSWVLGSETHRQLVGTLIAGSPPGWVVSLDPPRRTLAQNKALHSAFGELAAQLEWHGRKLDADVWKRLCVAAWLREHNEAPELVPALDGKGFDVIYERTSKMTKEQVSELLEWVYAFGAQNGVTFHV